MRTLHLEPLKGIDITGIGFLAFGQSTHEVEQLLGAPSRAHGAQWFYDELELRVDFNGEGKVEFLECIYGPFCEKVIPVLEGYRVFELPGEELVALLTNKNNGSIDDSEAAYGYSFLDISVGIYRDATPTDLSKTMEEMKAAGTYEDNKEWLEEDWKKANHFWTIGIGEKGYYDF